MRTGKLLPGLGLLCCLFRLISGQAVAQLPLPAAPVYAHYRTTNSSLPTGLIYRVHADPSGYLWLATDRGLVRYNGREFKLVPTGISQDFVATHVAGDSLLWLFSYSGYTTAVDFRTHKIIHTDSLYHLNKLPQSGSPFIVGSQDGHLLSLYGQRRQQVLIDLVARRSWYEVLPTAERAAQLLRQYHIPAPWRERLRPELEDILKHNGLGLLIRNGFITIGNRIFRVAAGREAVLYFDGDAYGLSAHITGFARRGDDMYLGSLRGKGCCRIRGYFSLDREAQVLEYLLPGAEVTAIEKDYLDNIWIATYGNGLYLFPGTEQQTLHYNQKNSGLYTDDPTYIGRQGTQVTVLGYPGGVAEFYRAARHTPERYRLPVSGSLDAVLKAERSGKGWLLFTRGDAFRAPARADGLPAAFSVLPVAEEATDPGYKDGKLYKGRFYYASGNALVVADTTGALYRHEQNRLPMPKRSAILPLSDSLFYQGTVLGCYRNASRLPYLGRDQVFAVDTVGGRLFWATNTGAYTLPLNRAEDSCALRRLITEPCHGLKQDSRFIYLRCNDELIVLGRNSLKPLARFSGKEYYQPFRLNDFEVAENYLMLAGSEGVFCVSLENLLSQKKRRPPKMHVLCSLNDWAPSDSAASCVYRSGLTISLLVDLLDYRREKRNISCLVVRNGRELYRQAELEENGALTLHPEAPGTYQLTFYVRYGYQEQVLAYHIEVIPLWYQQWWCLPLVAVALLCMCVCALYLLYHRKVKRDRRRLEERLYLQELEAQSLLGQLKPHFIFNVLTPLQGFFINGEKMRGLDYLDSFSRLMRGLLHGIRDRYAPLAAELTFVTHYLQVQQERFNHCFRYEIVVDDALDTKRYKVPTLLLQPLVENALEHGIRKTDNDGFVSVTVTDAGKTIEIRVRDNGRGLPPGFHQKPDHALGIITERMELLRSMSGQGSFSIFNNPDGTAGVTSLLILTKDYIHDHTESLYR